MLHDEDVEVAILLSHPRFDPVFFSLASPIGQQLGEGDPSLAVCGTDVVCPYAQCFTVRALMRVQSHNVIGRSMGIRIAFGIL